MDRPSPQSTENVQVQIDGQSSTNLGSVGTDPMSEPGQDGVEILSRKDSSIADAGSSSGPNIDAPEKKLTLFALQLAVLEKIATGLGTLGFIWATVVLLGGFAIILHKIDFWFITTILLIEGARIFSRSHEIEWQHQSTWTISDASISSFKLLKSSSGSIVRVIKGIHEPISESQSSGSIVRVINGIHEPISESQSSGSIVRVINGIHEPISASQNGEHKEKTNEAGPSNPLTRTSGQELTKKKMEQKPSFQSTDSSSTRTWSSSEVPLLPYAGWFFISSNISKLFYWLQLTSALACITLSIVRLIQLSNEAAIVEANYQNMRLALYIFYGLAMAEAFFSLLGKAYWEWTISFRQLLTKVSEECKLGSSGMIYVKRFFYDAYSDCINGSIFDGLKLDLVSFASELLVSDSSDERLIGTQILHKFSTNDDFVDDALQKIGTSISVIERLVEMLSWKNPKEAEIRRSAAEIVSKLAGEKHNSLRVAGIPGAMESISSLLHTQRSSDSAADEIGEKKIISDLGNYEFSAYNEFGLIILEELARDHDNCEKIGNTRGLLPKIIEFTHTGERLLRDSHEEDNRIKAVRRSLQVLKLVAKTCGTVGNHLRRQIVEIVFTVSNIREILKYGEKFAKLQHLGIEILTSLAFDVEATERIGSTGGIIKELFRIFFRKERNPKDQHVKVAAGEAIAMLALESEKNCSRILKQEVLTKLVWALEDPVLRINSARILRNLCIYAGQDCFVQLKGVSAAASTVLRAIISEENKLQEVMLGLATQAFRFMSPEEARIVFNQTEIDEDELAMKLLQILNFYRHPSATVPRMRRFALELAILMMKNNKTTVQPFRAFGMEEELEILRETTSEIESFDIFDGTIGLSRYSTAIHSLVENALELLTDE